LLAPVMAATEAVAYAHARGIVHRDLKPTNVLLGRFGETVVIDWGLAKRVGGSVATDDEEVIPVTRPGKPLGTPCYMPPEQARGDAVGPAADVYAIGAILYQVFSGRPPHEEATARSTIGAAADRAPTPITRAAPNIPASLGAIVERSMAREPSARYPNARELADDLVRDARANRA
jgi:eukaryotic-like serine/threonine-protein kinase